LPKRGEMRWCQPNTSEVGRKVGCGCWRKVGKAGTYASGATKKKTLWGEGFENRGTREKKNLRQADGKKIEPLTKVNGGEIKSKRVKRRPLDATSKIAQKG